MKKTLTLALFLCLLSYLIPYGYFILRDTSVPLLAQEPKKTLQEIDSSSISEEMPISKPLLELATFNILNLATNEVETVSAESYVLGSVAAEMPLNYPVEALKAQSVASYSYALARKENAASNSSELRGADFSANPPLHLGYVSESEMRLMWGEKFSENYDALKKIVLQVLGERLMYEQQPALSCYYAISNGQTESAENVWGSPLPYLVTVDSLEDLNSPEYSQTITFTSGQIYDVLTNSFAGVNLSDDKTKWFQAPKYSDAGYLLNVSAGGSIIKGKDLREKLSLRSTCIEIEFRDEVFIFTTRGFGHGVGMSQYGAKAMANEGKSYKEILAHYFTGTQLL